MEMDTAISGNFLSRETWSEIGEPALEESPLQYQPASKHVLPVVSTFNNSSDGRVVWSVCLLSCRLGFDSKSGQTNDFKFGIHSFPA